MHVILGAGGSIGKELAKVLPQYTQDIRLVSRNPKKVNPTDTLYPADLTKPEEVAKAVAGAEVVYLVVGFDYNIKVWRAVWPPLMKATIEACKKEGARLVFFDNVYMYDRNELGHMTEETSIRPTSKKGEVRKQIANMLLEETRTGNLQALIARSADFYGEDNGKSILMELVYKNLKKGKKAQWLLNASKKHSFTYTPDAAKATALLGNTPDAFGRVWHLPTAQNPLTGKEWVALLAEKMGQPNKFTVLPQWLIKTLGLFMPFMRELAEMNYQYDRDYVFDSSAFEKKFDFSPTSYAQGVEEMLARLAD